MKRERIDGGRPQSTRATVSVPSDIYQTVQAIAKQKKVSAAWVIRDAIEKYISEQWPLLKKR